MGPDRLMDGEPHQEVSELSRVQDVCVVDSDRPRLSGMGLFRGIPSVAEAEFLALVGQGLHRLLGFLTALGPVGKHVPPVDAVMGADLV